ncbi:MAG: DUF1653 domain-containing protein [Staphylococcus equorum]|nr:DUF1653 domain-containing protein [Staphylococcus equorum]
MAEKISGKYKHYKGNSYTVYCEARDKYENRYVLYRQQYGNKEFWIRPYDMFFDEVSIINETGEIKKVKRFSPPKKAIAADKYITELIELIKNDAILIKHSESEENYVMTNISSEKKMVCVQPFSFYSKGGGYLTEYELIRRLGYNCCIINDKLEIWECKEKYETYYQLRIENYNIDKICDLINPCSIDLRIADSGFLKTRYRNVDPESIEHASKATELWKRVKIYKSKRNGGEYFRLWPGQTVLTHLADRISIPSDCAGKIEIKSTYARLSLSITSGDFCNPGYNGYFPLEITNHGKHIVLIHKNLVMAQLMLIPLTGPILVEYSKKATYKNKEGYDDGNPYTFWRERSIKKLRKDVGNELLIELYRRIKQSIKPTEVDDINAYKERFDDTFLAFCQNNHYCEKYRNEDNLPDIGKLLKGYINREKLLKRIYAIRWFSYVSFLINITFSFIDIISQLNIEWPLLFSKSGLSIAFLLLFLGIILSINKPKAFCTFEKIDIEQLINEVLDKNKMV